MGLRYGRTVNGRPNCFESADVQLLDGVRDIPYTGALTALLVPTDSERDCHLLGVITDERVTLIVDCLHADEEVAAFRATCRDNRVEITQLDVKIAAPCPPPTNQLQLEAWAASLYAQLVGDGGR
jgi:hypothetical protein